MGLHILSNAFDNADGQLARLTNTGSRAGPNPRQHFGSHYIFGDLPAPRPALPGRGASPAIWLLALAAGLSHAVQGGFADYFRNAYLFFVAGPSRAEVDSSMRLRAEYNKLLWRRKPWQKFLLRTYLNFTLGQEKLSPNLLTFIFIAESASPSLAFSPDSDWLRPA